MMFIVLFLLHLFPVMSILDENLTKSEDSKEVGIPSENQNLLNEFLRKHSIPKDIIDTIIHSTNDTAYVSIWVTLSYIPDNIRESEPMAIMDLVDHLLPLPKSRFMDLPGPRAVIHGTFQNFISHLSIERYENKDWALRMWHPFRNNVIGLAAYKNDGDVYEIVEIYNNQTENIPKHNLMLAGYIPGEILNEIRRNKSRNELWNMKIRMVLIFKGGKFKELWKIDDDVRYFIGVNIPGYCKGNHIPFLKGYFRNESWAEMGGKYIDDTPGISNQFCLLSQMVFFGRMENEGFVDSVNENYCVDSDTGLLATSIGRWLDTKVCMYKEPCFDEFSIDTFLCSRNNKPVRCKVDNCPNDIKFPNRTKSYYDIYRFCTFMSANSYCNESFPDVMNGVASYYDFVIAVDIFYKITPLSWKGMQYNPRISHDLTAKGLSYLENDLEDHQITGLSSLIVSMIGYFNSYDISSNSRITSMIFTMNTNAVGFIIYKSNTSSSYDVKALTVNNATLDYASDNNVHIIAYVTKFSKRYDSTCSLYAFHGNYMEYKNQSTKSDVIGIYCSDDIVILNMYFKTRVVDKQRRKEYYLNEGYSAKVNIKKRHIVLMYIFELRNPICDPVSKLMVYARSFGKNVDFNSKHYGNVTVRNIDLLSHIAITVNENTQETHFEQTSILKSLTFILSSLSLIGISCIFLSAVFLKNWYQQRPYSIQLAISVAGETIFFLISEGYIYQIGYIIFYYFLLSQFIWMLIIGYLQYIRYVKVFEAYELNLVKTSLIGWSVPIVITSIAILAHLECLQCNFCSKNREILLHYFIIPISIIVVSNTGLYVYVLVVIARSGTEYFDPDARKARKKAAIFLPPILGITWIFFGMLFVPNLGVSVIGSYVFHIIASSQGLMVFIFVILLDKNTLKEWYVKGAGIFTSTNSVDPMEVAFRARE